MEFIYLDGIRLSLKFSKKIYENKYNKMKHIQLFEDFNSAIMVHPEDVKPGMEVFDSKKMIGICKDIKPTFEWKELKRYSTSKWMDDEKRMLRVEALKDAYLIIVEGKDLGHFAENGTEVFLYGENGVYCKK